MFILGKALNQWHGNGKDKSTKEILHNSWYVVLCNWKRLLVRSHNFVAGLMIHPVKNQPELAAEAHVFRKPHHRVQTEWFSSFLLCKEACLRDISKASQKSYIKLWEHHLDFVSAYSSLHRLIKALYYLRFSSFCPKCVELVFHHSFSRQCTPEVLFEFPLHADFVLWRFK